MGQQEYLIDTNIAIGFLSKNNNAGEIIPQLVGQIPWGHNREIITKCSAVEEAIFISIKHRQWQYKIQILLLSGFHKKCRE